MTPSSPHKQVPCKVTAYVDEHIKKLVEVLNAFDKVWTCDSCEGGEDREAFVCFGYGADGEISHYKTCRFICKVVESFSKYIDSVDCAGYKTHISINWDGSKQHPSIWIEMPSDCVQEVTNILSCVRRGLIDDNVDK